jgi:hypothetical protein
LKVSIFSTAYTTRRIIVGAGTSPAPTILICAPSVLDRARRVNLYASEIRFDTSKITPAPEQIKKAGAGSASAETEKGKL